MSGGLEDVAKSQRLSKNWDSLTEAEITFFLKATRINLREVYDSCKVLGDSPSGYWGESGDERANLAFQYYAKRFGVSGRVRALKLDDLVSFLNRLGKNERLEMIAEIITRKKGTDKKDSNYCAKQKANIDFLNKHMIVTQYKELEEKVHIKIVQDIFEKIDFQFP